MRTVRGNTYPNGLAKSALYTDYLTTTLLGCNERTFLQELIFIQQEEQNGMQNCEWRCDADDKFAVADVILRDVRLRILIEHERFTLAPRLGATLAPIMPITTSREIASNGFFSVFISYGAPDEQIAAELYRILTHNGVTAFFFPQSASSGQRIHHVVHDAIWQMDRVLVLCSKHSLNRPGLLTELEYVLTREASEGGSELIVPVILDDYLFTSWLPHRTYLAQELRNRVVADFRQLPNNAFQDAVSRLLAALSRPSAA